MAWLRKLLGISLFLVVAASAGGYWDLYNRLAREWKVPLAEQNALDRVLRSQANHCRLIGGQKPAAVQECLRSVMYNKMKIRFDTTLDGQPQFLLPQYLLRNPHGSCVPVSFLTLLLAERAGLSAQPVSLPGHVFVRFADGANWEPNRQGHRYQDKEYRVKYQLDAQQGRNLEVLPVRAFEGLLRYEYGNRVAQQGELASAEASLRKAQLLWKDPRVVGNLALVKELQGAQGDALGLLDSLWRAGIRSEDLTWNYALLRLRAGYGPEAIRVLLDSAQRRGIHSTRLDTLRQRVAP